MNTTTLTMEPGLQPSHTENMAATSIRLIAQAVVRHVPALLASTIVLISVSFLPVEPGANGKIALTVTAFAIIGWTLTRIPDSIVAVAAALLLVVTGVLTEKHLYSALGRELVWLLVASFIIAAVVRSSGLMERLAFAAVRPFSNLSAFFHAIAFVIALTAFLIPSTSGRAALLLPVFMALADRMPGERSQRALALLFPTVILLSAGGSMIGAGAHFIAVESIRQAAGVSISFLDWFLLAFPLTFLVTHMAVALILTMFVPAQERRASLPRMAKKTAPIDGRQKRIAVVLTGIAGLWVTAPLHGIGIALVAFSGAILLLTNLFTDEAPKQVFRQVEVELLIFLTAAVVIADGIILSGASTWMADAALGLLPAKATGSLGLVVVFLAVVAVLSHIAINSRSARAAVLLPALALPLAGFGHDVITLSLVTVLGTGFCQTMMASAKPVVIFGNAERATFTQSDLLRLALPLLPLKAGMIIVFSLFVWPHLMPHDRTPDITAPAKVEPGIVQTDPVEQEADLCTHEQVRTLMLATIRDKRMWSAGWWHVWDRLKRDGYAIERDIVRDLYRAEDMVRLRSHSRRFALRDLAPSHVEVAGRACLMPKKGMPWPGTVPVPKPRPPSF